MTSICPTPWPRRPAALDRTTSGLRYACAALLVLLCAWACAAHAAKPRTQPALPLLADFPKLSGSFARPCAAALAPPLRALGEPALRQCAWSERIELLYWDDLPDSAGACLAPAAMAWFRLGADEGRTLPAWDAAWSSQGRVTRTGDGQRAAAVWRGADGHWSAALWRWRPADKADTRAWQARHWDEVVKAAASLNGGSPGAAAPTSNLQQAWLDASGGKPRMLDGTTWRWVSQGTCLAMQTSGIGPAQLHLPYSRDDARLEQRSAMQVQLARRYPEADWLQNFTLLAPAQPGTRSGAKFIAVWREGAEVKGQLWMPMREGATMVRARIVTAPGREVLRDPASVKQVAALVQQELTAVAHAWEARHE